MSNNRLQQDKNGLSLHGDDFINNGEEQLSQQPLEIGSAPKGNSLPSQSNRPASPKRVGLIPQRPRNVTGQIYNLVTSTIQVMRGWTGKMAAIADQAIQPSTPDIERYPAPAPGVSVPLPERSKRWKRSRALRIAMMI